MDCICKLELNDYQNSVRVWSVSELYLGVRRNLGRVASMMSPCETASWKENEPVYGCLMISPCKTSSWKEKEPL